MNRSAAKELDPNLKPEEIERQAYVKAVRLLGSREHSSSELSNKLRKQGFGDDVIETILSQLNTAGYQCDDRFANLYAEQLLRKRYGPLAISAKLNARGIPSALSREAIDNLNACWAEVATGAIQSKFSMTELSNPDEIVKGKLARFLNRRGFSSTDSIKAIRLAAETVSD